MSRKLVAALSAGVILIASAAVVQLAGAHVRAHRGTDRAAAGSAMCGKRTTAGTYKHVIVIFEENHAYGSIYKSSYAPYINSVINQCGLATNYHNITHPSLPNYIAATTGASYGQLAPFVSDCTPSVSCQWTGNNIFYEASQKGLLWRGYAESMPSPCDKSNAGFYAPRHNPAVYDTDLSDTCGSSDVPLGTTSSSQLLSDFSGQSGPAPAYATVTPNLCNDMHGAGGCPSGNTITAGDTWLRQWLPKITGTPVYKAGQTAIFIVWDEGEPGTSAENCATHTTDQSCHVVAIVVAPSVAHGKKVATSFNHYSLLKSSEQLLGLPQIGQAKGAASMVNPFNL